MAGQIEGTVVSISDDGIAITDISIDRLSGVPTDESVAIQCEGHTTQHIFPVEHGQPEMTLIAAQGQSGFLEISLVGDSVATFLGIKTGSDVTVTW
ncbi:adenosylmethionine-8-amino-7-oxononanoate aminotransferase [Planctomycetota bacterium]